MGLLEELINKRADTFSALEVQREFVRAHQSNVAETERELADLDRAIAALSPAPSEEAGKGEDAPDLKSEDFLSVCGVCEAVKDARDGWEFRNVALLGRASPAVFICPDCGPQFPSADSFHINIPASEPAPDTFTISASEQHAEESARAQEPETRAGEPDWQNNPNVEIVMGEPWPMPSAYETTLTITTDNTAALPPLLPPEPPPAATPEQLEATGVIDGEAGWWARKLTREPA